jgi:hypothetical protein
VLDAARSRDDDQRVVQTDVPVAVGKGRALHVWVLFSVLVIAAALVSPVRSWYTNHPHGDPDPGGRRAAFLLGAVREATPAGATALHLDLTKSSWDRGGCDGGAPGWSWMEAVQAFRTTEGSVGQIDAAMTKQHWRALPVPGGAAVREYEPVSASEDFAYGWLFASGDEGSTVWKLDLTAAPAEVPTHAG